jgi:hypothetical protein
VPPPAADAQPLTPGQVADAAEWVIAHGAGWDTVIDGHQQVLIIRQAGRDDLTARPGDLLVWDGETITVRSGTP